MKNLMQAWADFVYRLSLKPPYLMVGSQAIYPMTSWTIPGSLLLDDSSMSLQRIGFTNTKIKMLTHHYLNEPTIERAKFDLDARIEEWKYGSGVWDFRGEPKRTTKQDYCMTAGVVAFYPTKNNSHTRVTIYYRTVELIFRYRADLVFLRDVVLPKFELGRCPPDKIIFQYANSTLHPMFYVMLLCEVEDPDEYLSVLKLKNPQVFREAVRWSKVHLAGEYRKYLTAARVQDNLRKAVPAGVIEDVRKVVEKYDHSDIPRVRGSEIQYSGSDFDFEFTGEEHEVAEHLDRQFDANS